jgi:hypothetical protein
MGSLYNKNKKVFSVTPNIIMSVDDNNIGEMYVYDENYGYILNGVTASDLVDFFIYKNRMDLSEEIINTVMNITIHTGTH